MLSFRKKGGKSYEKKKDKNNMKTILFLFIIILTACSITGQTIHETPSKLSNTTSKATIHIIDVGEGDTILVQQQNSSILIDCGEKRANATQKVKKLLNEKTIDLLIITHPDADHIGGCKEVINEININEVWENSDAKTTKTYNEWMKIQKNNYTVKK